MKLEDSNDNVVNKFKKLLKDGHQVVIEEFKTRTMTGTPSTVFTINVDRKLFSKEMLMHTQDLENIFNNFADKIIEED